MPNPLIPFSSCNANLYESSIHIHNAAKQSQVVFKQGTRLKDCLVQFRLIPFAQTITSFATLQCETTILWNALCSNMRRRVVKWFCYLITLFLSSTTVQSVHCTVTWLCLIVNFTNGVLPEISCTKLCCIPLFIQYSVYPNIILVVQKIFNNSCIPQLVTFQTNIKSFDYQILCANNLIQMTFYSLLGIV